MPDRRQDATAAASNPLDSCTNSATPDPAQLFLSDHRRRQREKQISFGKVTMGYRIYRMAVPTFLRQPVNPLHPVTPDIHHNCSKRQWDSVVGQWRRSLHQWDTNPLPATMEAANAPTRCDLGLEKAIPIEEYHQATRLELDAEQAKVQRLQVARSGTPAEEESPVVTSPVTQVVRTGPIGIELNIQHENDVKTVITLTQVTNAYITQKLSQVADLKELYFCPSIETSNLLSLSTSGAVDQLRTLITAARTTRNSIPTVYHLPISDNGSSGTPVADSMDGELPDVDQVLHMAQFASTGSLSPNGYLEDQAKLASDLYFRLRTPLTPLAIRMEAQRLT